MLNIPGVNVSHRRSISNLQPRKSVLNKLVMINQQKNSPGHDTENKKANNGEIKDLSPPRNNQINKKVALTDVRSSIVCEEESIEDFSSEQVSKKDSLSHLFKKEYQDQDEYFNNSIISKAILPSRMSEENFSINPNVSFENIQSLKTKQPTGKASQRYETNNKNK